MKVTESWLREWTNPDLDANKIAEYLTMSGLEVDSINSVAPPFSKVVVGKIIAVEQHPDADKLRVTQVDVGADSPVQIVCGAPNATLGLVAPTALVGAVLPGDFKIKEAKLRGVASSGMLCSAKELGIGEESDGLMSLAEDLAPGANIREVLNLDNAVIEVDLTPNRGDCLSVRGIARELSVRASSDFTPPTISAIPASISESVKITLQDPAHCPRYVGRVIKNTKPNAKAPRWLTDKLSHVGIRSHSLVVDVTNYVMLCLGQPMHAFDHSAIRSEIIVRLSKEGESLRLLNDKTATLHIPTLLITDANGPIAMAGIMGGGDSEVSDSTTDIFLEAAFFAPALLAGKAREYGMHTDASHRFERGVALDTQVDAVEMATGLIIEFAGGEPGPTTVVEQAEHLPKHSVVHLREAQIERKLGITIAHDQVSHILTSLGLDCQTVADGWQVTAPAWRFDINIEADLIEELGRIVGYDNIPLCSPAVTIPRPSISETTISANQIRQQLVNSGYSEVVAYSFIDTQSNTQFYDYPSAIELANPISAEMSSMRTSLLPGLLKTLSYNQTRQQLRAKLFDMGICFYPADSGGLPSQPVKLAGILSGPQQNEQWSVASKPFDFFDAKGDLLSLLELVDIASTVSFTQTTCNGFHPGQCAAIYLNDDMIGTIGAVHPLAAKHFQVKGQVFAFELSLAPLLKTTPARYQSLTKFPASRRDIAIIIDQAVSFENIVETLNDLSQPHLIDTSLFDVYQGDSIETGKKSFAISLTYQSQTSTMTDADIDVAVDQIVNALHTQHAAILRAA